MIITKNLVNQGWVDVYTEFGFSPGTPLIIHNANTQYLFLSSDEDPNVSDNYIKIEFNQSARTSYLNDFVWVKCDGYVTVSEALTNEVAGFSVVDLPHDLYTSDQAKFRRLRVDPGQTSFFEGREFRSYHEFDIPTGTDATLKITVPVDIILHNVSIELDGGSVRFRTLVDLPTFPVTENTAFVNPITVFRKNNMDKTPVIANGVEVFNGGSVSGGAEIDLHRVVAAGASGQKSTVGGTVGDERGVNPGTYYMQLESFGTNDATGVISAFWEEEPFN